MWPFRDTGGASLGSVIVEEATGAVTVTDGSSAPMPIDAFERTTRDSRRASDAVAKLPEFRAICKNVEKQNVHCMEYVSERPTEACKPNRDRRDTACLFGVYVGADMGDHASRIATFYVDPKSFEVVSVADMPCQEPTSLASFRVRQTAEEAGKPIPENCD